MFGLMNSMKMTRSGMGSIGGMRSIVAQGQSMVNPMMSWIHQQVMSFSLKSHSGASKRFKKIGNGKFKFMSGGRKHGMHKHSKQNLRDKGEPKVLQSGDAKFKSIRHMLRAGK